MKIVLVTENGYCGGLDSFIVSLINNWPHPEDELTLVCNASHPGLETIRLRTRRPCRIVGHSYALPWSSGDAARGRLARIVQAPWRILSRQGMFLGLIREFRKLFAELDADRLLVVNGGYPAGLSCRAATVAWGWRGKRPPAIHNFHNFAVPPRWWESVFENAIDRLVSRHSAHVVSVSKVCAESIRIRAAFRHSDRVIHIYNGIEPPEEAGAGATDLRAELGLAPDAPVCLMLGTYEPRKGHAFLMEAFAKVVAADPAAHLVICGFGYPPETERVRGLMRDAGLDANVHLQPFRHDVGALISQATMLVAPSQAFESFGLTIVEAMARGIPVIATRVGGIPEVLIDGEGGYLVEPDDVDGLAQRILTLLGDAGLRRTLGERGRQVYADRFRAARMADDYARLIRAGA